MLIRGEAFTVQFNLDLCEDLYLVHVGFVAAAGEANWSLVH